MKECSDCGEEFNTECLFLYERKLYCVFCLLYRLANEGKLTLNHNDFEEKGNEIMDGESV